jgi:phosphatidate cytidylyltransferase
MTYLDPSSSSGDPTRGEDPRRQWARHGGAAPAPYAPPYDESPYPEPTHDHPTYAGRSPYDLPPYPDNAYPGQPPYGAPPPYPGLPPPHDPTYDASPYAEPRYPGPPDWPPSGHDPYRVGPDPWPHDPAPADRPSRAQRRRAEEEAEQPTTDRPPGRAGRNLPAAIAVGVALVALVIGSLFFWRPAFLAVLTVAVAVGTWEMVRAMRSSGAHPPLVPLLAGGAVMVGLAWYEGPEALALGLLLTVLAAAVWRLPDGPAGYQRDLPASALIAVYVPFLAGFAAMLGSPPDGDYRVIVTLAAVVLSDTGGYVAGVLFGRHAMAPTVSPKKTWEGMAGSVTAAALGSGASLYFLLDVAPWWGALFGVVISVAAVIGDLAESMIKRDLGIKDMSDLLPGHGGLMDRLDSILFAVPAAFLLLSVLAPTG